MPLRRRTVAAAIGVTVGALVTVAGCGTAPRLAAPAPENQATSTPSTSPTGPSAAPSAAPSPSTSRAPSAAPTAKQAGPTVPATPPKPSKPAAEPSAPAPEPSPARPAAIMKAGSSGDQVRELQHRLRQLDWFAGTITGSYGATTTKGVNGFQGKRDLTVTGEVDKTTWNKLVDMTREPSRNEKYNKVVAGPAILKSGAKGVKVRELQARLKQLDWFSGDVTGVYGSITATGVRGFQGKRALPGTGEVDQKTWDKLVGMTKTPTKDALYNRGISGRSTGSTSGLDSRCLSGRVMCISKRSNSITWVVDGKAKLRMDVRFGSDETPTRNGTFRVFRKTVNGVSTLYRTRMPWAMTFSGGQAVHYSPDFAARGYNGASHGCVNVRDYDGVKWLWNQVRLGDKVVVYA
jgi:peptidoglycan hydrolase-like protein with peptidoglycan-binding domain